MQHSPQPIAVQQPQPSGASGSFAELAIFMKEQQAVLLEQQREAKQEAQAGRAEQKLELEQARQAMEAKTKEDLERLRAEMTPRPPQEAITDEELAALQARLESLHAAKLLADEELCAAEDLCADFVEIQASVPHVLTEDAIFRGVGRSFEPAVRLHKLVRLSSKMASDPAFARQLKRKFL